ncbi:MAG: GNAT family N-acetyltransferase [Bacteroidales bacterium]|nr:GNAT family N-acetyltransferase [Bacteroidales bacterium]
MKKFSLYEQCIMLPFNNEIFKHCSDFSCGNSDLDEFFHNEAELYTDELMGKTYCWITDEKPYQIVALFTLANDSIKTVNLNNKVRNRLNRTINNNKRGRSYPAVLIGRLGINKCFQNQNIGGQLLQFIKEWFRHSDNKTGCRFIVVDAYNNGRTTKFYESNNFRYLYENEQEEGEQYKIPITETILTRLMYCDLKL